MKKNLVPTNSIKNIHIFVLKCIRIDLEMFEKQMHGHMFGMPIFNALHTQNKTLGRITSYTVICDRHQILKTLFLWENHNKFNKYYR